MWTRVLRRVALAGATIVAGGLLSATLARYAPGFGADERQLDARLSSASIAAIKNATAEERSILPYYVGYMKRALRGNFGVSRSLNRPVRELLAERAGKTFQLAGKAMLGAWLAAAALVFATSLLRRRALALGSTIFSGALLCLPAGALALLAIILHAPAYRARALILFPKVHRYLIPLTGSAARMPHIVVAKAKGLSETRILLWHV